MAFYLLCMCLVVVNPWQIHFRGSVVTVPNATALPEFLEYGLLYHQVLVKVFAGLCCAEHTP